MRFAGVNFFRLADRKIAEIWNVRDDLGLREQIGARRLIALIAGACCLFRRQATAAARLFPLWRGAVAPIPLDPLVFRPFAGGKLTHAPELPHPRPRPANITLGRQLSAVVDLTRCRCLAGGNEFKVPREIVFTGEIPRNPTGKILRWHSTTGETRSCRGCAAAFSGLRFRTCSLYCSRFARRTALTVRRRRVPARDSRRSRGERPCHCASSRGAPRARPPRRRFPCRDPGIE